MLEEKELNIRVRGRNGDVLVARMQKHMPTDDMIFIRTSRGFTLFCQKNHPIIVNRGGESDIVIDAENARGGGSIWIDNSVVFADRTPLILSDDLIDETILFLSENLMNTGKIEIPESLKDIIRGSSSYNLRFSPKFLSFDYSTSSRLLNLLSKPGVCSSCTHSYELGQQLKMIADKLGFSVLLDVYEDPGEAPQFRISITDEKYEPAPFVGYDEIVSTTIIKKWKNPVYDIKTETGEFMLGCVQNHNSFHTGGAVDIKRMDIMKNIMENIDDGLESLIKSNFHQDENSLISDNDSIMIEIIKDIYHDEYKIVETPEFLKLPVGNFDMRLENLLIPMTVEQETKFYLKDVHREEDDKHIILSYTKGQPIFLIEPSVLAPEEVARRLDKYVGGKSPWTTPESLYAKFYKILSPFGDWDSVHLETILANILRWKEDPHMPARVKYPYNPATFGIKDLPGVMSYPLGIAFENFSKSITYGMISERGAESSIEKVFFGEPLTGDKYKPKK